MIIKEGERQEIPYQINSILFLFTFFTARPQAAWCSASRIYKRVPLISWAAYRRASHNHIMSTRVAVTSLKFYVKVTIGGGEVININNYLQGWLCALHALFLETIEKQSWSKLDTRIILPCGKRNIIGRRGKFITVAHSTKRLHRKMCSIPICILLSNLYFISRSLHVHVHGACASSKPRSADRPSLVQFEMRIFPTSQEKKTTSGKSLVYTYTWA